MLLKSTAADYPSPSPVRTNPVVGAARTTTTTSTVPRRHRLPMRSSSPYVGWFRHAPPSSSSARLARRGSPVGTTWATAAGRPRSRSFTSSGYETPRRYHELARRSAHVHVVPSFGGGARYRGPCSSSLIGAERMKSSPYVGWFRHAPPSQMSVIRSKNKIGADDDMLGKDRAFREALEAVIVLSSKNCTSKKKAIMSKDAEDAIIIKALTLSGKMVDMSRHSNNKKRRYYVDGRLRGGCPLHEEEDGDGGEGVGVFPFDDDDEGRSSNTSNDMIPLFDHHRVFSSIHESASTRGLHFTAFAQAEDDDDGESAASSLAARRERPSSDLISSIDDGDDDSVQEHENGESDGDGGIAASATFDVLNRLANRFVSLRAPADTTGSPHDDQDVDGDRPPPPSPDAVGAHALYGHVGPGATTALLPLFTGMLTRALLPPPDSEGQQDDECEHDFDSANKYPWEGYEACSEVDSEEEEGAGRTASRLLDVSVSSLAEAYYAHRASEELFLEAAERQSSSSLPPSLASSPTGHEHGEQYGNDGAHHHPLDYVITQIDIARMVRNASRHLDVESILGLPTVTYRAKGSKSKHATAGAPAQAANHGGESDDATEGRHKKAESEDESPRGDYGAATSPANTGDGDDFAWSWMIVPPDPEDGTTIPLPARADAALNAHPPAPEQGKDEHTSDSDDDDDDEQHCVICLDRFVDGDRLRVLPCSHLFHAGCIDRWLSGSASDVECFTAGCPTCKERVLCGGDAAGGASSSSEARKRAAPEDEHGLLAGGGGGDGVDLASSSLDGSVPRWAFARLGDAMAGRAGTGGTSISPVDP